MRRRLDIVLLMILMVACSEPSKSSVCVPCPPPTPIPPPPSLRFVNHPRPEYQVNFAVFEHAGCPANEYEFRHCMPESPLAALGCDRIEPPSEILGALDPVYPIASCYTTEHNVAGDIGPVERGWESPYIYVPDGDYLFGLGALASIWVRYVIYQDGHFVLIETEDEFRAIFAPIETADEALAYVKAVTNRIDYYGLEADSKHKYFAYDIIEDTYVKVVPDGYIVHLYDFGAFGCGPHLTYAMDFHITPQGHIQQLETEVVWKKPSGDNFCAD